MKSPADTSIGGAAHPFPSTIWSDILAAADPTGTRHRERLASLLTAYWKPVFIYIRVLWRKSVEDSKDLTQAFFAHVLEKNVIGQASPDRGSFRGYLRRTLKNFLIDGERAAEVRRPAGPVFSLDAGPGELDRLGPESPADTPDEAYDRAWFAGVLEGAVGDLKAALEAEGKGAYFRVFEEYCLKTPGGDLPSYRDLVARVGVKLTDVENYLKHCRRELKRHLRERIRLYVASDEELERELALALRG